jgi:hypothetical protein
MEHVGLCNFRSLHWRHVYHKRQLGQEDTDTSTHRQSHTDREVHVHPHESYQQVHWHASAKFTLINAKLVGCGRSVGGVSHYTAQEIQTCTPQIGTLYVCIESLLTLGALSLRSAHLGARALLAQTSLDSGFWNQVLHDYVGIRKALRAVSQVLGRSSTLFFLVDQFCFRFRAVRSTSFQKRPAGTRNNAKRCGLMLPTFPWAFSPPSAV